MTTKISQFWQVLTDSLWFIPGLMILLAMGLGLGLVELEYFYPVRNLDDYPLLFGVGADGSRGMLSAVAGSMLTVAGLTFSLTLSAISQVSSQYSPRLLRNFMSDRVNQFVMGYFTGSFAYCLIVLRTVRGGDERTFVPSIAVLGGLLLALGGVLALILFIHHIAESMQVGTVIYRIMDETTEAIDDLFPQELGEPVQDESVREEAARLLHEPDGWTVIDAPRSGYLQHIDNEKVLEWALDNEAIIRLEHDIGWFVGKGLPLMRIRPLAPGVAVNYSDRRVDTLYNCVQMGRYRTVEQDARFGIQQLVDVALKALSPGINDTTTAIMAIDHLGVVMNRLISRSFPSPYRTNGTRLCVLTRAASFEQIMAEAFDLIRVSGKANHAVFICLLRTLDTLSTQTTNPARLAIVRRHISLVRAFAGQTLETDYEKAQVRLGGG